LERNIVSSHVAEAILQRLLYKHSITRSTIADQSVSID